MNPIVEAILAALVTVIICLGITCWLQHGKIDSLQAQLITASNQKASADTANATLKGQAQATNNEIESIQVDDKKREDAATTAVKASDTVRQKKDGQAASVLSQKVDANDCTGAAQVLHSYLTRGK